MAYLTTSAVIVVLVLAMISILVGIIDFRIYQEVRKSSKEAMTKLKLQPEKTEKEFKHLFLGNFVMLTGLIVFGYGAYTDEYIYRNIGRIGFAIFAKIVLQTQYKWLRRFDTDGLL